LADARAISKEQDYARATVLAQQAMRWRGARDVPH